jgi:uncharacterized oxidoreductase
MLRVQHQPMRRFARDVFEAAGSSAEEAGLVADHLVDASLMGHESHGIIRISKYVDWVRAGHVLPNQHIQVANDRGGLLVVDGRFGFGQVIGKEAMELAADRAGAHGVATLALRNSGHLGRIGAWAELLARRGYASIHFVNTSGFGILVAPHGGSDRRLSANPIAAGVAVPGRAPIILDIATSVIAEGKIQIARNKGEKLPPGTVLDGHGRPTTDAEAFYADPPGAILPFGGHKGSGLSFFCEVLAGSLSGGFASNPQSPTAKRLVNNMLSLVFDPASFGGAEAFAEDIERLAAGVKSSPPIEAGGKVFLPGELEEQTRSDRELSGLAIDEETWRQITAAATSLGVDSPKV